jgi:hypothetical protein
MKAVRHPAFRISSCAGITWKTNQPGLVALAHQRSLGIVACLVTSWYSTFRFNGACWPSWQTPKTVCGPTKPSSNIASRNNELNRGIR